MTTSAPTTKTENRTCPDCGNEFEAATARVESVKGLPITFSQCRCDSCLQAYENRRDKFSTRSKSGRKPWTEICPPCYLDFDRDKLPPIGANVAQRVLEWREGPKGIGLIGPSRAGKTFILHELMRRWYEQGRSVHMPTSTEFAYACGSREDGVRDAMIERSIAVDLLYIDDIGKERVTDRVEADLFHVLEKRRRAMKPVFTAVNSTGDQLAAAMSKDGGVPIINRLKHDLCEFITVQ